MSNIIKNLVINKSGIPLLTNLLDSSAVRHKLVAANIANVSTPGFQSKDIDFHGELKKAITQKKHLSGTITDPAHLLIGQARHQGPEIIVNKSPEGNGINNVDIDHEVTSMAANQVYYSVGARLLALQIQGLRNAIKSK
jgi:flagellar basal-body rod protein FlgB